MQPQRREADTGRKEGARLSPRKQKALYALLFCPTRKAAAEAAGISESTLRSYLKDPEFISRYKEESAAMLDSATRQLQGTLTAAIDRLGAIVRDDEANSAAQISAARSLLEFSLKFTEFTDILQELEGAEQDVL